MAVGFAWQATKVIQFVRLDIPFENAVFLSELWQTSLAGELATIVLLCAQLARSLSRSKPSCRDEFHNLFVTLLQLYLTYVNMSLVRALSRCNLVCYHMFFPVDHLQLARVLC